MFLIFYFRFQNLAGHDFQLHHICKLCMVTTRNHSTVIGNFKTPWPEYAVRGSRSFEIIKVRPRVSSWKVVENWDRLKSALPMAVEIRDHFSARHECPYAHCGSRVVTVVITLCLTRVEAFVLRLLMKIWCQESRLNYRRFVPPLW